MCLSARIKYVTSRVYSALRLLGIMMMPHGLRVTFPLAVALFLGLVPRGSESFIADRAFRPSSRSWQSLRPESDFSLITVAPRRYPRFQEEHREERFLNCHTTQRSRSAQLMMLTSRESSIRRVAATSTAAIPDSSVSFVSAGTPHHLSAMRRSNTALAAGSGKGDDDSSTSVGPGTQSLSRQAKLAVSILIDLIGMSSYALPGLGEVSDLGWAPISSALILYLYGNSTFAGLAFVEEILPGLDFIPTATIAWFLTNSEVGKNVTNAAATKGKDTSSPASASSPPPPQEPSGPGSFWKGRKSNKVDEESVQKGVIDVDAEV